jgi:adenosylcobinamide kinase/adenosylcobinamide-phosphate guanylyltransferase
VAIWIKESWTMELGKLTLVVGGAASGKSAFAEALVMDTQKPRFYLATAQAFEDEMHAKIERHKDVRGSGWTTIEAPLDLAPALSTANPDHIILLDCATLWLSNHLLSGHDLTAQSDTLLDNLSICAAPVVVVSNEVGAGIVPDNALSRQFREAQGRLNQRLAAQADLVVTVIAGLPLALKGTLPEAPQ